MTQRTAVIIAGCPEAPDVPICGLPRRQRLAQTLAQRGYRLVDDVAVADLIVPDCLVLVGRDGGELHLCSEGLRAVEDRLLLALRKPIDGLVSRHVNRRLSLAVTRRLMNTRITPNQISCFTLLLGLASGVVVGLGGYTAGVLGALLFQLQSVLDGVDGELARLRFQGSRLGQWLDTISDDLASVSFMTGALVATHVGLARAVGVPGLAAFLVNQGILYYALATVYHSGDLLVFRYDDDDRGPLGVLKHIVRRDFVCLGILALALADLLAVGIVLWSVGAVIAALVLVRQTLRRGLVPQQV